jgi:purine catabolism regulator
VEEIAVTQGAAAAALEWAKQNAVDLAEERMRATFVDELLASEIADEQAWIQRGASLGYELTRPHVAWMVQAQNVRNWPGPLLRFAEERGVHVPASWRDEGLLLFWPIDNPNSGRELKSVATEFVNRVQTSSPQAEITVGIGRPGVGPAQWYRSQQQARESWRLGKTWRGTSVTYFGDLGLYQLLTALGKDVEAARFYRKTLGKLIDHDQEHNAELVETLEAFFAGHGNLSQTAGRLHIHRNTLTYRLDRIAEITQLDLNDADARFSLQLALKLRPVMK